MTRGGLKERISYYLDGERPRYEVTDAEKFGPYLDECLAEYSRQTLCTWDNEVAFTLTLVSDGVYDIRAGANFARPMARIADVAIENVVLRDMDGNTGPVSYHTLTDLEPAYAMVADSRPVYWLRENEQQVRLWPAPDQAYANCWVSGWAEHTALTSGATHDDTVVDDAKLVAVPERQVETLAQFCAMRLLSEPRSEVYAGLAALVGGQTETYRADAIRASRNPLIPNRRRSLLHRRLV